MEELKYDQLKINLKWYLPQIVLRAAAEVMVSISLLQFAYTQVSGVYFKLNS